MVDRFLPVSACQREVRRASRMLFAWAALPVLGGLWLTTIRPLSAQDQGLEIPTLTEAEAYEFFETQVKPLLADKCLRCHNAVETNGSLDLTTRMGILNGGDSGPAVEEGSAADSLLLSAINYDAFEMPPTGKLSAAQIRTIEIWLHLGMPWSPSGEALDPGHVHKAPEVNEETKAWWAFQPP